MNGWEYTNKQERPEVVTINGEKFLKLPQLSRKRPDGSVEVHPAFIINGTECSHIYRGEAVPFNRKEQTNE